MDSSVGGASISAPALIKIDDNIRRMAADVVDAHRNCDVSDSRKCDLYHHLITMMQALSDSVRAEERALMVCGHPNACGAAGECFACARDRRIAFEAERMR